MSRNIKISSLDQAEDFINRLNNQVRSLDNKLQNVGEEARRKAQDEAASRIESLRVEMWDRQKALDQRLAQSQRRIDQMDRAHCVALRHQADNFFRALDNQEVQFERKISTEARRTDELIEKEKNHEEQAKQLLKDVDHLLEEIGKRSPHTKYAPERYQQLVRKVQSYHGDLPPQSIIGGVIGVINELWDLEEDVLREQLIFEKAHGEVLTQAIALLEIMVNAREEAYYTDDSGAPVKNSRGESITIELDYWTRGNYRILEQEGEALYQSLERQKDLPEFGHRELEVVAKRLQVIAIEQQQMICLAVEAALRSEERVNISEDIIEALLEQGFDLEQLADGNPAHNYLGGEKPADMREGVYAKLKNGAGMNITLIVQTDEALNKNQILIQRNDDSTGTEGELLRNMEEMRRIIRSKGYEMRSPTAPAGTGDQKQEPLFDAEVLQSKGLSREFKERSGLVRKTI